MTPHLHPANIADQDFTTLFTNALFGNQFVSGGLMLLFIGSLISIIYKIIGFAKEQLMKQFIVSLDANTQDQSYGYLVEWLSAKNLLAEAKSVTACVYWPRRTTGNESKPYLVFSPSNGSHFFIYQKKFILLQKSESTVNLQPKQTIKLMTYGDITVLKNVMREAMLYSETKDSGISIFTPGRNQNWEKASTKPRRPLSSVILSENSSTDLIKDITEFMASRKWYEDRGIAYKRGYLFYGPPGSGKSSLLLALASEFDLNVCTLSLSSSEVTDANLNKLFSSLPSRAAVVLEDVDSLFEDRSKSKENSSRVTFSGLLNAIDGVASSEGRLLFLTTNHKERLAPALIRPGRADLHLYFGLATSDQIERMFKLFYPSVDQELIDEFLSHLPSGTVSMAKLQGHFLNFKNDPQGALDNIRTLLKKEDGQVEVSE